MKKILSLIFASALCLLPLDSSAILKAVVASGGSGTVSSVSAGTTGLTVTNPTTTPTLGGTLNLGNISVNKANRAPNNNDDWTQGYYGDGSIDSLYLSTAATGCSGTPTMSFSAPQSGGVAATGHFLMSQVTAGTVVAAVLDTPGYGYNANATVTVSNTSGCSGTPAVTAYYNPNGDLWNYNGKVFVAHSTAAGQAVWQYVPTPALPVDAVQNPVTTATVVNGGTGYGATDTITLVNGTVLTVATRSGTTILTVTVTTGGNWTCPTTATYPQVSTSGSGTGATFTVNVQTAVAAYGTRVLTQCYNGSAAADIVRASDSAQLTVGFVNSMIDTSSIEKWGAGTTLKWAKIYNQILSGADATQATDANRPALDFGQTINGLPLLLGGYMTIPSSVAYNSGLESAYMLTRSDYNTGSGQGLSGSLFNAGIFPNQNYYQQFQDTAFGYTTYTNFIPTFTPEIIGGSVSGMNNCVWAAGDLEFPTTSTCANPGAQTGGTIGYSSSSQMAMGMFVLWPRALSASERLAFRAAVVATYGLVPQARSLQIWAGDSRTAGDFATNGVGYPTQIESKLPLPIRSLDVGKLGAQASNLVASCFTYDNSSSQLGDCTAFATQRHDSNSWAVVWDGYNDCQASVSAATYYANLTTYIGYMHGVGAKVAVVTDPAGCSGYSTLVQANGGGADLVINNLFNDPAYGSSSVNWTSQTFFASGPHPSTFGHSFVSTDIATPLSAIYK